MKKNQTQNALVPVSTQVVEPGLSIQGAIDAMPKIWEGAAVGPDGKPSRNQFSAAIQTLRSRLALPVGEHLPGDVFKSLKATAATSISAKVASFHAGAFALRQAERGRVLPTGATGLGQPDLVAVRASASMHELSREEKYVRALLDVEFANARVKSLCEAEAPQSRELRDSALASLRSVLRQRDGHKDAKGTFIPGFVGFLKPGTKVRLVRPSGWLADHAKSQLAADKLAIAEASKRSDTRTLSTGATLGKRRSMAKPARKPAKARK